MRNTKWYELLLPITYIGMVALCVYLNVFTRHGEGTANIIVNGVMFFIVAIIFLKCQLGSFRPVGSITADLKRVKDKIHSDALRAHQFLWQQYKNDGQSLFEDDILKEEYRDFLYEMDRISKADQSRTYYRCDIEDYINFDLTDSVIHRNMLNQVSGAMTGLGILGTFIGLSLGLQSFNTGTTAEITNSIAPLMDGIKVAFHTSIYGMIFSLVFNYVYKRKLEEAEAAVDGFVNYYKKYVLPDTSTDGINRQMELMRQQNDAIHSLDVTVKEQLPSHLTQLLAPQFDRFNKSITDFREMATENQMAALSSIVNSFVAEMNRSLGDSFNKISYTVNQNYTQQQENARQMQELLLRTGGSEQNMREIERQTGYMAEALTTYTQNIQNLQNAVNQNIIDMSQQTQANQALIEREQDYLTNLGTYSRSLTESAEVFVGELKEMKETLSGLHERMAKLPDNVENSLKLIDNDLLDTIDAIGEVRTTLDRLASDVQRQSVNQGR